MSRRNRIHFFLIFWPLFLLRYLIVENHRPASAYIAVFCAADRQIPFREEYLVFYLLWYVLLLGLHLYTLHAAPDLFISYSRFLLFSFTLSTVCFLAFPTCQNLRPEIYPRDNLLTRAVMMLHTLDTNTNVCPSEHVLGTLGALTVGLKCPYFPKTGKASIIFLSVGICLSTVFLKQHSVMDIAAAIPIYLVSYYFSFQNKAPGHNGSSP